MKRLSLDLALAAVMIASLAAYGSAQAQDDDNDSVPKTNPNLSCANFNAEALSGDPRAM